MGQEGKEKEERNSDRISQEERRLVIDYLGRTS